MVATGAVSACLTDPPPDLPLQSEPPIIIQQSLQPPAGLITSNPTAGFVVPVQIADPAATCQFSVFDESDQFFGCHTCDPASFDAGVVTVNFGLGALFDPTECHTITFTVASSFSAADPQCRSGSDVAIWEYRPPSGSCVTYDAAALGDGAFPEAGTDALPIVPDSGDEP
jgi:hypothetical protein